MNCCDVDQGIRWQIIHLREGGREGGRKEGREEGVGEGEGGREGGREGKACPRL